MPQINPIFLRVLTTSGRRSRHAWVRAGYLVVMLATLIVILLGELGGSLGGSAALAELGEKLFHAVSYAQLVLILMLAPIYTVGAITQERDSETFSVLLATPLSNLQIVLGSLVSRLFFVLAILFSTLPLFALLYYFGGFVLRDVLLSYGIAATSATLTGSVAIAIGILYTGTRRVMVGFFLFIVAYLIGTYALDHSILPLLTGGAHTAGSLDWINPVGAIQRTLVAAQTERPLLADVTFNEFWIHYPEYGYLIYSGGLSVLIIALAAVLVRRLARGYGRLAQRVTIGLAVTGGAALAVFAGYALTTRLGTLEGLVVLAMILGIVAVSIVFFQIKRHRKPHAVWDNPIAWRERTTRTATARRNLVQFLYILLSVLAVYAIFVMKVTGFRAEDARIFVLVVTVVQMFVMLTVGATLAASCISYEREQGTLDIMLSTPITPRYFIIGKALGIIRYLGMFLAMMFVVTLGAFLIARLPVEQYFGDLVPRSWVAAIKPSGGPVLGGTRATWDNWPWISILHPLIVAGAAAAAMVTVGMTFSLRAKSSSMAAMYSALVVLGFAASITCCCGVTAWIPLAGHSAVMASPFLAMFACIMPEQFQETYDAQGVWFDVYRVVGVHVGVVVAAAGYGLFTWFRMKALVTTFDQQTRQKG
jgi:ABC-type transport system involved in multi-copper enzyme maturation permease subunit